MFKHSICTLIHKTQVTILLHLFRNKTIVIHVDATVGVGKNLKHVSTIHKWHIHPSV